MNIADSHISFEKLTGHLSFKDGILMRKFIVSHVRRYPDGVYRPVTASIIWRPE